MTKYEKLYEYLYRLLIVKGVIVVLDPMLVEVEVILEIITQFL